MDHSLTSTDIVYLKEQGVSEKVISYLINQDHSSAGKTIEKSDAYRVYYKTDKKGKRVKVVTNLDEKGNRIGGELPPEANQPEQTGYTPAYEPPREIYVTVRQEPPPSPPEEDYQEPEEPAGGIPVYDSYYPAYYPGYRDRFPRRRHCCNTNLPFDPTANRLLQPNWHFDAGYSTKPRVVPQRPQTPVPGSSSGYRRTH